MPAIKATVLNLIVMVPLAIMIWNYLVPSVSIDDQFKWLSISMAFKNFAVSGAEFSAIAPKLCPVLSSKGTPQFRLVLLWCVDPTYAS
jgi:hypothetical protein